MLVLLAAGLPTDMLGNLQRYAGSSAYCMHTSCHLKAHFLIVKAWLKTTCL